MKYIISGTPEMTYSQADTIAAAIADSVRARRLGLDGTIAPDDEATPQDCDGAAALLGLDRDPASVDMDRPIKANIVANDLASA
jgi:hypothetical protein